MRREAGPADVACGRPCAGPTPDHSRVPLRQSTCVALRLPAPCLVVLVGPSCSGKSTWAAENFRPDQVVSSDALRALVGTGEHDERAGKDAFDVLQLVLERRLRRRLVTVVDTLGFDGPRPRAWRDLARRHGVARPAVHFDTPAPQ